MKTLLAYLTGTVALVIVVGATTAAIVASITQGSAALMNLANSTLSGLGIAIGGCLGSALLVRFKMVRKFIGSVLNDIETHQSEYRRTKVCGHLKK